MGFYDLDETSTLSRVEQLIANDKDGSKQQTAVSDQPHGPVKNTELLARSVDYPSKFEHSGGLNDTLFQDAFTHGASAQRLTEGWDEHAIDVHRKFEEKAHGRRNGTDGRPPKPEYLYIGVVQMTAEELRACKLDGEDLCRVRIYDAGNKQSDNLHAEIVVDAAGLEKPQKKELRVRLMTLATKRGLFVSPHLPFEDRHLAIETQCELH